MQKINVLGTVERPGKISVNSLSRNVSSTRRICDLAVTARSSSSPARRDRFSGSRAEVADSSAKNPWVARCRNRCFGACSTNAAFVAAALRSGEVTGRPGNRCAKLSPTFKISPRVFGSRRNSGGRGPAFGPGSASGRAPSSSFWRGGLSGTSR